MFDNWTDKIATSGTWINERVPGPIYSISQRLYRGYIDSSLLNRVRRARDYGWLWFLSRVDQAPAELHLGCGREQTTMCDIDLVKTPATNYVLDARTLPFPDDSVERIESYHMIEHVPQDTLSVILSEWGRVLEPSGRLVVELPAFDDVVLEYLNSDDEEYTETLLRYVFGSQRFDSDYHYWGWNEKRLADLLQTCGFKDITRKPATDNHAAEAPCMRIEATVINNNRMS